MAIDIKKIQRQQKDSEKEGGGFFDFLNRDIRFGSGALSDKKKEAFFSELLTLLSSGIDMRTALEIITEEQKKKKDRDLFESVKLKVLEGSSLSNALNDTGRFSAYEFYSLKIGEETGRITEVLNELSVFLAKKIRQRRQLINAFTYPVMVLITAIAAVLFMLNVIVPMFKDVYNRFHGELPALTRLVIRLSETVSANIGWVTLLLLILVIVMRTQRRKTWYRSIMTSLLLRTPVIGKISRKIYISRYCQAMALLIASRTPMLRSIEMVRNMIGFYPLEQALDQIGEKILNGALLHESMREFPIFDKRLCSLVKVGEEVNQLDSIFNKINKQYSEEIEHEVGILSSLLEPILIIFVGLLVAVILVSMYMPLFQLSTGVMG